jgi:hypothetical protein
MPTSVPRISTSIAAAAALGSSLLAQPAAACGGFFCDNSQPVNQAAERIIFAVEDDGTVTATIQIQYAGDADAFAWVLPVEGSPAISVSSDLAFARLQAATNPQYLLTTTTEGTCADGFRGGVPSFDGTGSFSDAAAADAGPSVSVVDEGTVGPYDYVVISVDPAAPVISDVAVTWLRDNGYQIDPAGAERLAPYLEGGMNLLAFRLTSGRSAGSIRPVRLTFGAGLATIPIRPTAVAAVADMGVLVWVLGRARAIPVNYFSLELNEALINWLSPGGTYDDVVNEAANQAGGQGFVTEMAGDAAPLAESIFAEWERSNWDSLAAADWTNREGELLNTVINTYGGYDGFRDALAAHLTLPEGVTIDDVLGCLGCTFGWDTMDVPGFEPAAFLAAVETNAIVPMEETAAMFRALRTVTRFYTTMSADEMTRDPAFDFNANLGDVSNVHQASRIIECSPSLTIGEAPWRIVLPSGETVRGSGTGWPFTATDGSMPANARISRLETDGDGVVVTDNVSAIAAALSAHNATIPRPTGAPGGGGFCAVGTGRAPAMAFLLGLAGLALLLRRRS